MLSLLIYLVCILGEHLGLNKHWPIVRAHILNFVHISLFLAAGATWVALPDNMREPYRETIDIDNARIIVC